MIREEMTIHTALREINTIEKKINKITEEIDSAVVVHPIFDKMIGAETIADWRERKKGLYQSFRTNVNRRQAIKMAIAESNAKTMVTIKSYSENPISVAAAIDLLSSGCSYEETLMRNLSRGYSSGVSLMEKENKDVSIKADVATAQMYGKDKDGGNASSAEASTFREEYIKNNGFVIEDPLGIPKLATAAYEKIENIKSEIDAALSNSNALTTIVVEYENG